MTPERRKFIAGPVFPLLVLTAALLISLLWFAVFGPDKDGRVFFYPSNSGATIGSERRGIPEEEEIEDKISIFLDELLLGPETLSLSFVMPRGTTIRNVAAVDKTVYVDLSIEALDISSELSVDLDEALSNLRYNILYNFSRMDDVVFTIEGSQVNAPYYQGEDPAE